MPFGATTWSALDTLSGDSSCGVIDHEAGLRIRRVPTRAPTLSRLSNDGLKPTSAA